MNLYSTSTGCYLRWSCSFCLLANSHDSHVGIVFHEDFIYMFLWTETFSVFELTRTLRIHFGQIKGVKKSITEYGKNISTESPSFGMTICNACFTKLMVLLHQSRDCSCYVRTCLFHLSDCILPACEISLSSLTLYALEAGDFVKLLGLYYNSSVVLLADCWREASVRKVLRPATSIQVFLVSLCHLSKYWDGSHLSKLPLHASHVALPT
jgi:hypothetical protein